ncbi:MAG TPA: molybdopterin cofactor-binding domain-containing protein [Ktedonosporobacter sp.]|jgi:putative selenate reductase molybdopterin-binding subunit|nr:molybdopterin cofactor-binding domain-containing protein [Ktedonosporobacter sp.]
MELELRINGVIASVDVAANESLLTMLRREGYCSVKQGCETGECGACTVLVDGVPRPSCVMLAAQAGGCTLATVESLEVARSQHPLQKAFIEVGAVQCGFCAPGMLLAAYALLKENASPTESEVRDALSGNLCRCTGYEKPVQAVLRAAAMMRGEVVMPPEHNIIKPDQIPAQEIPEKTSSGVLSTLGGKLRQAVAGNAAGATTKIPVIAAGHTGTVAAFVSDLQVIGQPVERIDAARLVTGKASFVADSQPRGMLYGQILTSPHAHAVIRNIDISEAKTLPGVHAVLTYRDVPRTPYASVEYTQPGARIVDQYCLDYVMRYTGDRVAAVAAETPEIAERAIKLIRVEYDPLPPILDPRQALNQGAPRLHPEAESHGIFDASRNIAARLHAETGDVERGFAEADLVIEGEYFVPVQQQAPIENHTVITYFDEDNSLIVRTSTEAPHYIRRVLASLLAIPSRRIRVVSSHIGGSLGAKQEIVLEDLCALLTVATNRPVMLAYSRQEEFRSSRTRQQYILRLKTGVKRDGTIIANQLALLASTGAYATHPLITQGAASSKTLALYPCPNMRFVAEILYTSQPPMGAARGYESAPEFFALESHMDEIAKQLGMDALELRRKNWIKVGDEYPLTKELKRARDAAPPVESCGLPQCLQTVVEKLNWSEKRGRVSNQTVRHGVGLALALYSSQPVSVGTGGAMIKLNEDGSFDVFAGANDGGSGSETLLAQIAAEVLGVPVESILMHTADTSITPFEMGSSAASTLYVSGGAVKRAAEQVRRQILTVGGRMLNTLSETLKIRRGVVVAPGGQKMTIQQIAAYSFYVENRHIMTTASWKVPYVPLSFAAQGVEVEVDTATGCVRVVKVVTAVDAGQVINPMIAEGQVHGNIAQALGASLSEELVYDQQGKLLTTSLHDYHIYAATEMPQMQTYFIETYDPSGPFGAKAIGEIAINTMAPAIANAIADALGIRIRQLPFTPERMLKAIHAHMQAHAHS